jgi:hypothetical protein
MDEPSPSAIKFGDFATTLGSLRSALVSSPSHRRSLFPRSTIDVGAPLCSSACDKRVFRTRAFGADAFRSQTPVCRVFPRRNRMQSHLAEMYARHELTMRREHIRVSRVVERAGSDRCEVVLDIQLLTWNRRRQRSRTALQCSASRVSAWSW